MTVTTKQLRHYQADPVQLIKEQLILENGQAFGAVMADFQEKFFRAVFARHEDGRPVHRLVYSERRRGESKSSDLAAAALADLLVGPPGHRSFAVAADLDQAQLVLDSVRDYRDHSPMLADIEIQKTTVTNQATGSQLRVMSSDSPTSYGIRPRRVYFDELSLQADEGLWMSMWSSIGKSPYSQMVTVSMAGFDFASLCWRVREQAAKNPSYYFATREGSTLAPWLSERDMAEQRASLPAEIFQRLWECQWSEGSGSLITRQQLDGCVDPTWHQQSSASQFVHYFAGLDLGLVKDRTARAVVHMEQGGTVVLDDLKVWSGSRASPVQISDIEADLIAISQRFRRPQIYADPWQFAGSLQRLQGKVAIQEFKFTSETVRRLSENLLRLVRDTQLRIYPDRELEGELLSLQMMETVTGWRMDHRSGRYSDRAMALAMAALFAVESAPTTITPEAMQSWRELLADLRSPGGASSAYSDVTRIPGLPDFGWRT